MHDDWRLNVEHCTNHTCDIWRLLIKGVHKGDKDKWVERVNVIRGMVWVSQPKDDRDTWSLKKKAIKDTINYRGLWYSAKMVEDA